jgi:PAS domain S-box-containing protein
MAHTKTQLQHEHRRTLSELERYKMLVENVEDYAIFFMDTDGYIQTWNKGAQKNKGYAHDEIIGKHFSISYSDQDNADNKPQKELEIAKRIGRVEDEDWRIKKDGTRFWANVVITALYDDDNQLQGFAKVTRNLTERKENEDNLKTSNNLLREQQKELQRLNDSKDEFISLASHQLRTPATAIKQLLGLLIEGYITGVPENVSEILKKTYESNERQIGIVNSLLKVAQIDSGKVVLRKHSVDINGIIKDIVVQYEGIIGERKQLISFTLHDQPLYGSVDEHYYRMAIENILDNASKYTGIGGTIHISTKQDGEYASIAISDTGVGIKQSDIATLFEKFNRIPNEMSHTVSGSGLGLYWVEKVIELHDGTIDVKSDLGRGTTFTVKVPGAR